MQQLINELKINTSLINKKTILSKNDTPEYRKVFRYTYDSSMTYGVKFARVSDTLGKVKDEMFIILDKLSTRELSGDKARYAVENYALHNGDLIKLICNKDLGCGVSTTILNTVYGKYFIPKFAIQLAKEEELYKLKFPIWAQLKYNGARVIAIYEDGKITLKSRGGHTFICPAVTKELLKLDFKENCVLDGELTFGDSQNTDHTGISGLVNSSIKTDRPVEDDRLCFNVFDYLSLEEFNSQTCYYKYEERFLTLNKLVTSHCSGKVKVAINYIIDGIDYLQETYQGLIDNGYEGLILKYPNDKYTYKKNRTWIKMKATATADLMCIGYEEGKNKYEGQIGSLICEGKINGKLIKVNVGSGLDDEDRGLSPNYYIGHYIEVDYNKVIQDTKTGSHSLFLPRFVSVRKDKS